MKPRPDRPVPPQRGPGTSRPESSRSEARPSVVVVTTTFPARAGDGTPEFVLTLARSLPDHEVVVVAPRVPDAPRREIMAGVRVRRVPYFPRRWEGLAKDAIMPTLQRERWRVVEIPPLIAALLVGAWGEVRRNRPAVVNAHWIMPGGVIALLLRLMGRVPYVVTVHGADAYMMRGRAARFLKRRVLRRAAAVLPVSRDIARTLGVEGAPVLRMGVDTASVRSAVGDRRPEAGLLVFVGRLADKKGVDVLLDALVQLDARLEVIGDGPDREDLEARARRLGIDDRVVFRGKQPKPEVLAALARAQLVVIPSRVGAGGDMEGTPVVLCEAMAAGVPVVASDLGGLGECIDDGVDGLLVPPGDVDALAKALHRALTGAVDLDALGRAAAATAGRILDIGAVGEAYARTVDDAALGVPTR